MAKSKRDSQNFWASFSGVVAAALGLLLGEFLAAYFSFSISPLSAIGGAIIDLMPDDLREWAIQTFGTADKAVLFICLGVAIAILAGVMGALQFYYPPWGVIGIISCGLLDTVILFFRSSQNFMMAAIALLATLVAASSLHFFIRRLQLWAPGDSNAADSVARRRFLTFMGAGVIIASFTGVMTGLVRNSARTFEEFRQAVRLPTPIFPAKPLTPELNIPRLSSYVTPNREYYRIDVALVVPRIDPSNWQLKVTGMVEREITLNLQQLLDKPMTECYVTLSCVSNEIGGSLVGNARWLGWPVRELLAEAGVKPEADMVLSRGSDGFTAGTPLEVLTDDRDALLALGMNGEVLPQEHGFPVRLVVPGLYGYVSATKWLTELKVTRFADDRAYWTDKGWSAHGPIKQMSRIDVPRRGDYVPAGLTTVAGMAWAQPSGISAVHLRVNQGPWRETELGTNQLKDAWVQWKTQVDLPPGSHELQVRCVNNQGEIQTDLVAGVVPDGASGHHTIKVNAE